MCTSKTLVALGASRLGSRSVCHPLKRGSAAHGERRAIAYDVSHSALRTRTTLTRQKWPGWGRLLSRTRGAEPQKCIGAATGGQFEIPAAGPPTPMHRPTFILCRSIVMESLNRHIPWDRDDLEKGPLRRGGVGASPALWCMDTGLAAPCSPHVSTVRFCHAGRR
jgi:hypothetical protein